MNNDIKNDMREYDKFLDRLLSEGIDKNKLSGKKLYESAMYQWKIGNIDTDTLEETINKINETFETNYILTGHKINNMDWI